MTHHSTSQTFRTWPFEDVVQPPGKGWLCCGAAAEATADVQLYRAWAPHYDDPAPQPTDDHPTYQFGPWWSTAPPDLSNRNAYRRHAGRPRRSGSARRPALPIGIGVPMKSEFRFRSCPSRKSSPRPSDTLSHFVLDS